jgi:ABC-type taurine transport system substrate-binding protein
VKDSKGLYFLLFGEVVLWFEYEMPPQVHILKLGPQVVVIFWEVVEILGSYTWSPVLSLLPVSFYHEGSSFILHMIPQP